MSWVKFCTHCYAPSFAEIAFKLPEGHERKKEFERLVEDVGEETKQRAVQGVAKAVVVGRKSM